MRILITSPSLKLDTNISGISYVVNQIIYNSSDCCHFIHFVTGKGDKTNRNIIWLFQSLFKPIRLLYIIIFKKVNIIHVNTSLEILSIFRDFSLIFLANLLRVPVIMHVHGGKFLNQSPPLILSLIVKLSLILSDRVIVLSGKEKNKLEAIFNSKNFFILFNSVNISSNQANTKPNLNNIVKLLYLGRIDKNKGLAEIVKALHLLQEKQIKFHFSVCGTGPDTLWFLDMLETNIYGNFSYYGIADNILKEHIFSNSHIFLLPSYFEGLPISMLEAMSYGCVPIVTNVGSISETISDYKNGLFVSQKSYTEIVAAIEALYSNNLLYISLSKNARDTIIAKFNSTVIISSLQNIYSSLSKL